MAINQEFKELIWACYGVDDWEFSADWQLVNHDGNSNLAVAFLTIINGEHGLIHDLPRLATDRPILVEDSHHYFWIICPQADDHQWFLFGPTVISSSQLNKLKAFLTSQLVSSKINANVTALLKNFRVLSINQLMNLAQECFYMLNQQLVAREKILIINNGQPTVKSTAPHSHQPQPVTSHHGAYEAELAIADCVQHGDLNYRKVYDQAGTVSNGVQVMIGSIEQARLSIMTLNFICSRAAMRGGLSPAIAFTLADNYTEKIIHAEQVSVLQELGREILDEYVHRVNVIQHQQSALTPPIRLCKDFIDSNIEQKITLESLATVSGYSKDYLSHQFNQEMGCSVSAYVNQQKIKRAKNLLDGGSKSAREVADTLHFSSPAYFGRVFHQLVGQTPFEYQHRHFNGN